MTLWEDLLVLRAKWAERCDGVVFVTETSATWKKAHDDLDEIIKAHTRAKVPYQEK